MLCETRISGVASRSFAIRHGIVDAESHQLPLWDGKRCAWRWSNDILFHEEGGGNCGTLAVTTDTDTGIDSTQIRG
jgi:hypothetical protein